MWVVSKHDMKGSYIGEDKIYEVLTVGHNSFRRADDALPVVPVFLCKPVYMNGSIYWYHKVPNMEVGLSIVEFNCATEKFGIISIPDYITDINRFSIIRLMEVDCHLALFAKKKKGEKNNHISMKMYFLSEEADEDNEEKNKKNVTRSNNSIWVEEDFSMPPFNWDRRRLDSALPIPGTDLLIVRSADSKDDVSFYYYNWKKRSYSNKVDIDGISSLIPHDGVPFLPHCIYFSTFTESLIPVN
ncbi:hypothetical protein MKX03_020567 [Papaver bracteatum]|nr:hypothetical protein MKX03_020567 [Papaver bracteatum]